MRLRQRDFSRAFRRKMAQNCFFFSICGVHRIYQIMNTINIKWRDFFLSFVYCDMRAHSFLMFSCVKQNNFQWQGDLWLWLAWEQCAITLHWSTSAHKCDYNFVDENQFTSSILWLHAAAAATITIRSFTRLKKLFRDFRWDQNRHVRRWHSGSGREQNTQQQNTQSIFHVLNISLFDYYFIDAEAYCIALEEKMTVFGRFQHIIYCYVY